MIVESEHGHFSFHRPGPSILWIRATGAWNAATTKRYVEECKALISEMKAPIARIADLRDWQFGPPEIMDELTGLYRWMSEHGVTRQIDLVSSALQLKMHLHKIEPHASFRVSSCTELSDAVLTLESEGWDVYPDFTKSHN